MNKDYAVILQFTTTVNARNLKQAFKRLYEIEREGWLGFHGQPEWIGDVEDIQIKQVDEL